jgi:predicted MFS family arabinose efflux permease
LKGLAVRIEPTGTKSRIVRVMHDGRRALRNFSAGGWAGVTEWLVARLGFRHVVVLSLVAGLVAFLIAPVGTLYFAALSVLMVGMIDGVAGTLMITEMNRRLEQDVLATANSLVSLISRLMVLSVTPILMLIAKHYGPAATFFLMAIFVFCALVFVIGYFRANRTSGELERTEDRER